MKARSVVLLLAVSAALGVVIGLDVTRHQGKGQSGAQKGSPATTIPSHGPGTESPTVTPSKSPIKILDYVSRPNVDAQAYAAQDAAQFSSPLVYGISWKFTWAYLEPSQGAFNWAPVDQALAVSSATHKKAVLRVYSGIGSPSWIYRLGAPAIQFSNQDVNNPSTYSSALQMPIPWDSAYLQQWDAFVLAFGQRYHANPGIYLIEMAGAGYIGEMELPHSSPHVISQWQSAGFSDQADLSAWETIVRTYRSAFPGLPTALDIGEPLGKGQSNVMTTLVDWALQNYPGRVWLQQNGLNAGYLKNINQFRSILRSARSKTTTGYQLYGGGGSNLSAKTGNRLQAFEAAVQDGVSYVEVYGSDIADSSNQQALSYLARGDLSPPG